MDIIPNLGTIWSIFIKLYGYYSRLWHNLTDLRQTLWILFQTLAQFDRSSPNSLDIIPNFGTIWLIFFKLYGSYAIGGYSIVIVFNFVVRKKVADARTSEMFTVIALYSCVAWCSVLTYIVCQS
jgi:hypothetical protein